MAAYPFSTRRGWQGAWLTVVLALAATAAGAGELSEAEARAVDRAIAQEMRDQEAVGVAIGVIRDGEVVYTKGYGFEDREARVPVGPATLFRWASVSKPVTAVAALQLVEQGKLDLDADVRTYVPEFPETEEVITVRHLMCHQSGIVHYSNGPVIGRERSYSEPHPYVDVIVALDTFADSPLVSRPGEAVNYSTHAYILLSAVVERAGGAPYREQVRDRISGPLGLDSLRSDDQWVELPHRAVGYRERGGRIVRSTDTDVSWKLGGGGFISTIDDFARFAADFCKPEGTLLSAEGRRIAWTPQATADGSPTTWGLGFSVEEQGGTLKVSHNGSQEKVKTRMVLYPDRGDGMVVMSNSEDADPGRFSTAAYRALASVRETVPR